MTTTQYNSNNSLTPEFKWTSFEKRNNLDELINIPIKAEERSMIQISCRTQDPNIKTGTIRNPRQKLQLIHDPLCFQNPLIRSIWMCKCYDGNFTDFGQIRRSEKLFAPLNDLRFLWKAWVKNTSKGWLDQIKTNNQSNLQQYLQYLQQTSAKQCFGYMAEKPLPLFSVISCWIMMYEVLSRFIIKFPYNACPDWLK